MPSQFVAEYRFGSAINSRESQLLTVSREWGCNLPACQNSLLRPLFLVLRASPRVTIITMFFVLFSPMVLVRGCPYWFRYGPDQLLDNLVGDISAGSLVFRTLALLRRRPDYVTIAID